MLQAWRDDITTNNHSTVTSQDIYIGSESIKTHVELALSFCHEIHAYARVKWWSERWVNTVSDFHMRLVSSILSQTQKNRRKQGHLWSTPSFLICKPHTVKKKYETKIRLYLFLQKKKIYIKIVLVFMYVQYIWPSGYCSLYDDSTGEIELVVYNTGDDGEIIICRIPYGEFHDVDC